MAEATPAPRGALTRATVVFADITGFTALSTKMGVEEAYLILTRGLRLLDGIVRKHGGSVDKYLGDCLMAVFGYPVPVASPAAAAARACLEMREQLREYTAGLDLPVPLDVVIGINTGPMVAGDVGGPVVREFHVLGDAVNVSARMKAKAPLGSIYVGPESHAETRDQFRYRTLEPIRFKGKSEPVPVFELLGEETATEGRQLGWDHMRFSECIGRDRELQTLRSFAASARASPGAVLSLVGEEGLGKSRLLAELGSEIDGRGLRLLHASGRAAGSDRRPLALVAQLLGRESQGEEAVQAALEELAGPALVLIDDLEAADAASLEALESALEAAPARGLSFVLASRPEFDAKREELLAGRRAADPSSLHELRLEPLGAEACARLVDALEGSETLDAETRGLVQERGAGNPARLVMATFLAPSLRTQGESRQRSGDAERRRSTILFADITGFTAMTEKLGAETAYPIVVGCLQLLDEVARKHGGTVDKYLGDCVLALFGVPEAIEDAPRAAMNAAIEMRRRVREYNEERNLELRLDVHSGINTGLGIAGDVSGPMIREFAVMGDPVTVADQLKDLAPSGRIFVGGESERFTREVFDFEPREPLSLKGRAERVPVFELLSQEEKLYRARIGSERQVFSVLVGRDREFGALRERVAGLSSGSGSIASLIAEAGIGKSRLVAELAASPEAESVVWLEGRSLSTGQQLSFHPFADLGRSWARIDDEDDDAAARAKLEAGVQMLLPEQAEEVFPFLATLMGMRLEGDDRERVEQMRGDALARMIQHGTYEMLRAQSERGPVVVVLDDLHWADQSSVDLVDRLLPLAIDHPILFLNVSRPGFASTSGRVLETVRGEHAERHLELALQPLDQRAARQLIANLFRQGEIPFDTRRMIEERSQGNPFYIEEVVRSLLDAGAVEEHEGRFRATERIGQVEIPGTIQEVVMARLDRLEGAKRRLLQTASVVGGSFHRDVLAEIHGEDGLDRRLDEMVDGAFLAPSDRSAGVEYAFKHPLIQEITYDGLLHQRREEIHGEVARAMETCLPPDLPGRDGMLAFHFGKGRDLERTEEYLFRAGDEAARAAGSSEALHFFREASQLYLDLHGRGGDPTKKARLQRSIAEALYYRGQLMDAVEAYNQAMEHLGERVPRSQRAMLLRFARDLSGALARLYTSRPERQPPADEIGSEVVDLMFRRGLCEVTADSTRFLFDTIALLSKLTRSRPDSVRGAGGMYAASSVIFSWGGISFGIGRKLLDLAGSVVDESDVPEYILYRVMKFTHHFFEGDWSAEHEIPESLVRDGLAHGRTWDVLNYVLGHGDKHIAMGDFETGRRRLELNDQILERFQNELARSQHYFLLVHSLLEQRRLGEAVDSAQAYYEENPEPLLHIHAFALKGKAHALRGELEAAEEALEHGARILKEQGELMVPHFMKGNYWRSRLLLDVAQLERACADGDASRRRSFERRARHSQRRAVASAAWVASRRPEVYRLAGRAHWLAGRRERARRWWERALETGRGLGTRPEVARTLLERGSCGGSEAELAEARGLFESLELSWDLEQLERRSAETRRAATAIAS